MFKYDSNLGILTLQLNYFSIVNTEIIMPNILVDFNNNGGIAQIQWFCLNEKQEYRESDFHLNLIKSWEFISL